MKRILTLFIVLSLVLQVGAMSVSAEDNLLSGTVITSNTKSADTSFLTDGIIEVSKGAECTQTRTATYFLIDFGKETEVNTLELYEFNTYKTKRLYGYKIETSEDGEKFKQIAELSEETEICSENLADNLFKGTIVFPTVKTRYLKLTVRKAKDISDPSKTAVGYTSELKAFLNADIKVPEETDKKPENGEKSELTITSNTQSADTSFLTDGIIEVSRGAECTQTRSATYFLIDFGKETEVDTFDLYEFNSYKTKRLYGFKVETSSDGEKFKKVAELSEDTAICNEDLAQNLFKGTHSFSKVNTRYLKITVRKAMDITDPSKTAVGYTAELKVYLSGNSEIKEPLEEDNSLYKIYVDGKKISFDADPLNKDGRLLVPFRAICEALGMTVSWNDSERKVTAIKGANSIIMTIDNPTVGVNGTPVIADVAPTIYNSRTLVPLRFLAEAIGCEVGWDGNTNTVTITTKE